MKCQLTVVENGRETRAQADVGARLLDALAQMGVAVTAPCGGHGRCGKCLVRAEGALGGETNADGLRLACETVLLGDARVTLNDARAAILTTGHFSRVQADGENGLGVAVDVGTTTLAAYLINLKTGDTLCEDTLLNPQRAHGADVISRLSYAMESPEHARALQEEMLRALQLMTENLLLKANRAGEAVCARALVGNTVMMHLLGGYPVRGLAAAPFAPAYTRQHALVLGGVQTLLGGCVSGYVGADTVAALLACDLDEKNENAILIDIGTNGEIAAMKEGKIVCCSCAAGPAFEGAHIACGMGAVAGAIDHARFENGHLSITTIQGAPARGICGSGLVDITACLCESGDISPMGRMERDYPLAPGVYLARGDVREVQLAKAAIAAGIEILLQKLDMDMNDVQALYIAGGFGNYIRLSNACAIGMLPKALLSRAQSVGNAAGEGAKRLLVSQNMRARAEALRTRMDYIELAAHPDFADLYADNLLLGDGDD